MISGLGFDEYRNVVQSVEIRRPSGCDVVDARSGLEELVGFEESLHRHLHRSDDDIAIPRRVAADRAITMDREAVAAQIAHRGALTR
jgi:hypothetical protein